MKHFFLNLKDFLKRKRYAEIFFTVTLAVLIIASGVYAATTIGNNISTEGLVTSSGTGDNYFMGDVGVGTTAPGAKLDVAGRISQTSTGKSVFLGEGAGNSDDLTDNMNVFVGYQTGYTNSSGMSNTAVGHTALFANTSGNNNTAVGKYALVTNVGGSNNTAMGYAALDANAGGGSNTAMGYTALFSNADGNNNTAIGRAALYYNTAGSNNVAIGYYAGRNETGSNTFYVNNVTQSSLNNDRNYSLLYGTFSGVAGSTAGQQLVINGNVGIGTTNPLSKLDINGGVAIGTYAGVNAAPSNGAIISGNVGIGTTAPLTSLEVNGIIKTKERATATCDANAEGGIYYDSDDSHFYGCDGTTWHQLDN
jgi:hypothetical protein